MFCTPEFIIFLGYSRDLFHIKLCHKRKMFSQTLWRVFLCPVRYPHCFVIFLFDEVFNFLNVQDTATLFFKTIILKRKLTNWWVMYLKERTITWIKGAFFHEQFYSVFFFCFSFNRKSYKNSIHYSKYFKF